MPQLMSTFPSSTISRPIYVVCRWGLSVLLAVVVSGYWWVNRPVCWKEATAATAPCSECVQAADSLLKPISSKPGADKLLDLMGYRLSLMHEVARWKWNTGRDISDPTRERALLGQLTRSAKQHGLHPGFARSFFEAQIEAAKQLQQADFDRWRAEKKVSFSNVLDLKTVLRPAITSASDKLLTALADIEEQRTNETFEGRVRDGSRLYLQGPGITDEIRATVIAPLLNTKDLKSTPSTAE